QCVLTNASRGTVNARRFQSHWAAVVSVVVFEFSGMRCQPLRRALTGNGITHLFSLSFKLLIYIDNKTSENKRLFWEI
ncbi:hypothetical protein, partial [Vibrio cholerae]|uniref:hypothetical protein n=1 Tax=Vibrio cholerae TaxID=666 RepID=UPI0027E0F6E1